MVMVLGLSTQVLLPTAGAATPSVHLTFPKGGITEGVHPIATICWTGAPAGAVLQLDGSRGYGKHPNIIFNTKLSVSTTCQNFELGPSPMGIHHYFAKLFSGFNEIARSNATFIITYRHLAGAGVFAKLGLTSPFFGCTTYGTPSTVTDGSNTYPSFCSFHLTPTASKATALSPYNTTCRAITLEVLANPTPNGGPSTGGVTVSVIQGGFSNPQTFTVPNNQVTSERLVLNGTRPGIVVSSTTKATDSLYVLSAGTSMSCWTGSGH